MRKFAKTLAVVSTVIGVLSAMAFPAGAQVPSADAAVFTGTATLTVGGIGLPVTSGVTANLTPPDRGWSISVPQANPTTAGGGCADTGSFTSATPPNAWCGIDASGTVTAVASTDTASTTTTVTTVMTTTVTSVGTTIKLGPWCGLSKGTGTANVTNSSNTTITITVTWVTSAGTILPIVGTNASGVKAVVLVRATSGATPDVTLTTCLNGTATTFSVFGVAAIVSP